MARLGGVRAGRADPQQKPFREGLAWQTSSSARLPEEVVRFRRRAILAARVLRDELAVTGSAVPRDLAALLELTREARLVVELGTAAGWTALSIALVNPACRVLTVDDTQKKRRHAYSILVPRAVRSRVEFRTERAELGCGALRGVDVLFVDVGWHSLEETRDPFLAWEPAVRSGGTVVFHDYRRPDFPGVAAAIDELGLTGELHGGSLFVWRKPV